MKKTLLFLFIGILFRMNSQTAQFSWMAGSTFTNQLGTYGTQGVSSTTNAPGSRALSVSWTSADGKLWMFGGNGHATTGSLGNMNDLWNFNPTTNEWVWVTGSNVINQVGLYGTKGVPSTTNTPGSRNGSITWVDNNGGLWLFGGQGYGAIASAGNLNDLWKYNTATSEWVWVTGSNVVNQLGIYGTKGVPSTTNCPGARTESISWVDNNGNLWLFGGIGKSSTPSDGLLNDLWKYDIASNEWTWVSGGNGINSYGGYGTLGVGSVANLPGTRSASVSFKDNNGDFWLFGGNGFGATTTTGMLGDLWKYTVSTNEWTWMSGSNNTGQLAVYGTKGYPAASNKPSGRMAGRGWVDSNNNLWLYGGYGPAAVVGNGGLNDLWQFNKSNNLWVWVSGANIINSAAVYGTLGVASQTNTPGARLQSAGWKDNSGDFWLFAGKTGTPFKNDLWKISPCNAPSSPVASASQTICVGSAATLTASGIGTLGWYSAAIGGTYLGTGNTYATSTLSTNANYYVQDSTCAHSIRTAITVVVTQPSITIAGTNSVCSGNLTTFTATGATSYTWNNGATTSTVAVSPTVASVYTVTGADAFGCISVKTKSVSILSLPALSISGSTFVCKGTGAVLSASGANSYTWSTGSIASGVNVAPSTTTVYSVTGTGANGCRNIQTHTIEVYVVPVTISGTYSICSGSSTTFTASGATSYTWSSSVIGTVYGPTVTVYPSSSFNYSITAKDATNCSLTQTFVITPLMNPAVNVAVPAQQCPGAAVTLTASGASTYTWMPGGLIGTTVIVTPTVMTNYTVTGTAANTCTDNVISTVSVKPNPSISITASQSVICEGATVSLYGNGSTSNGYVWSTGQTTSSITSSPSVTTTYTLTGTGTNGCSADAIKTVTVNSSPNLQVATTETLLCVGQTATLTATGANTYTWNTGSSSPDLIVSPTTTSSYTVTGTGSNGCSKVTVYTQSVSVCTGIDNIQNEFLYQVFPNPSNGIFTIRAQVADEITLTNELGQVIQLIELSPENQFTYHVYHLESGIYFLSGKSSRLKLIVTQ